MKDGIKSTVYHTLELLSFPFSIQTLHYKEFIHENPDHVYNTYGDISLFYNN
jgi:hypothetical protein